MLKNIGVRLNIRQIPSSEYSVIVTGKRFDMFYFGISQTDPCGIAYICQNYCSDSTLIQSGLNSRRWTHSCEPSTSCPPARAVRQG